MVAAKSSNERPYVRIPTKMQPARDSTYWSYSDEADDGPPPVVPPKDPNYSQVFLSPVSTSFPPDTYKRPRYTSLSVYEPKSARMAFPEPQLYRSSSRLSVLGATPPVRHRMSKSDIGLGASSESLWSPNSSRGSYAATVIYLHRSS